MEKRGNEEEIYRGERKGRKEEERRARGKQNKEMLGNYPYRDLFWTFLELFSWTESWNLWTGLGMKT